MIKVNKLLFKIFIISSLMTYVAIASTNTITFGDLSDPCLKNIVASQSTTGGFDGGNSFSGPVRKARSFRIYADVKTPCTVDYIMIDLGMYYVYWDEALGKSRRVLIENTSLFKESYNVGFLSVGSTYYAPIRLSTTSKTNANFPKCLSVRRWVINNGITATGGMHIFETGPSVGRFQSLNCPK